MVRASLLHDYHPSRKVRLEHPLDLQQGGAEAHRRLGKCARDSTRSTKRCKKERMGTGASGNNDAKRSEGHTAPGDFLQHRKLARLAEFPLPQRDPFSSNGLKLSLSAQQRAALPHKAQH